MINFYALFDNVTFILFVLMILMAFMLMSQIEKYRELLLGIRSVYGSYLNRRIQKVLNDFIETLESVPEAVELDKKLETRFLLKLGQAQNYVEMKTDDGRSLSQQCLWAFGVYLQTLNFGDETKGDLLGHSAIRPIVEFFERAEVLGSEKDFQEMLKILENGDELFLSRFEQSLEIISEFKNNPEEFLAHLLPKEEERCQN